MSEESNAVAAAYGLDKCHHGGNIQTCCACKDEAHSRTKDALAQATAVMLDMHMALEDDDKAKQFFNCRCVSDEIEREQADARMAVARGSLTRMLTALGVTVP